MCFSVAFLGALLVKLIVLCAIFAIIRLVIPAALGQFGFAGGIIGQIINIVAWAVFWIIVVWFMVDVIECLFSMGGGSLFGPHHSLR